MVIAAPLVAPRGRGDRLRAGGRSRSIEEIGYSVHDRRDAQ
jgi:hypothetical protein